MLHTFKAKKYLLQVYLIHILCVDVSIFMYTNRLFHYTYTHNSHDVYTFFCTCTHYCARIQTDYFITRIHTIHTTYTHFFVRVHTIVHVYKYRRAFLWFSGKLMVEHGTGSTALSMEKKCCCLHVWARCRWTLPKGSNTLVYATLHRVGYAAGVRGGVLRVMLPGTILNKSKYYTV